MADDTVPNGDSQVPPRGASRGHRLLLLVLLVSTSCYVGLLIGYGLGGPQHEARFALSRATSTTAVLRRLRGGSTQDATAALERELDTQLVLHLAYRRDLDRALGWFLLVDEKRWRADTRKLIAAIRDYRAQHLYEGRDDPTRRRVNEYLNQTPAHDESGDTR